MAISEMRRLKNQWDSGAGWPKRLEWVEIKGIRGWTGEKVEFNFPIVAIVGENGVGKSKASHPDQVTNPLLSEPRPDRNWTSTQVP